MAAQEILSPIIALAPPEPAVPQDAALLEMARELSTERNAARAILSALKELEGTLATERDALAGARAQADQLEAAMAAKDTELQDQRVLMFSIHSDLQDVQRALIREREKALWRRVFKR